MSSDEGECVRVSSRPWGLSRSCETLGSTRGPLVLLPFGTHTWSGVCIRETFRGVGATGTVVTADQSEGGGTSEEGPEKVSRKRH